MPKRSPGRHRRPKPPHSAASIAAAAGLLAGAAVGGAYAAPASAGAGDLDAPSRTGGVVAGGRHDAFPPTGTGFEVVGEGRLIAERGWLSDRSSRAAVRVAAAERSALLLLAAEAPPAREAAALRTAVTQAATARVVARQAAARQQAARVSALRRAARLVQLRAAAVRAARAAAARAPRWVLPVTGYRLTADFGAGGGLWSSRHTGQDFAAPAGRAVRAVGAGVVVSSGWDGAYGRKIVLRHGNGTETWYCHLSSASVSAGQRVGVGQRIGGVGSTGNSTGNHLHFEVHPAGGGPVSPLSWLRDRGLRP